MTVPPLYSNGKLKFLKIYLLALYIEKIWEIKFGWSSLNKREIC